LENKDRPSLDDLFHDLYNQNPNINRNACKDMLSFWPKESKLKLLENLKSEDITIRRKSIIALSSFGKEVVNSVVNLYLSSQQRLLQISCLKVLIKVAANNKLDEYTSSIDKVIEGALNDYSVEITLGLVNLLRQLGNGAVPTLIEMAKDKDILRSKASITALGEISDPLSRSFLEEFSRKSDIDPIVKEDIIISLEND